MGILHFSGRILWVAGSILLASCRSDLKVNSKPSTAGAPPCTEGESCETANTPDEIQQPNQEEPAGEQIPVIPASEGLTLVVKTEDGQIFRKEGITNAVNPVVTWETMDESGSISLTIATDAACTNALFEFEQNAASPRGLDFLNDGTYYLCAFQSKDGGKIAANNNGIKLILDRTKPALEGMTQFYLNAAKAIHPTIVETNEVQVKWEKVSGPGSLTFSSTTSVSPLVAASLDGTYELNLTLTDSAGNSVVKRLVAVWDTTPPVLTSFSLVNHAADGYINSNELSLASPVTDVMASGFDAAAYSDFVTHGTICNASQAYPNSSLPTTTSLPFIDSSYVLCIKLSDLAGNATYGTSGPIVRDTTPPAISSIVLQNEASNGVITLGEEVSNLPTALVTGSGYTAVAFSAFDAHNNLTCDASKTYDQTAVPLISNLPPADGDYAFCASLMDAAGNAVYGKSPPLKKDIAPPDFVSMLAINEAVDGIIGSAEVNSGSVLFSLNASGYSSVSYSNVLNDSGLTCNASQAYPRSDIPSITDVPATDNNYAVCVRLQDTFGNLTYGKSQSVTRDTQPPTLISLALTGVSADGFISGTEASSAAAFATLNATDYTEVTYTNLMLNPPSITCDNTQVYLLSAIPAPNSIATDGIWAACVKLIDAAGNITYGKSASVTRDTVAPIFTSLIGANGASDHIVNQTEFLSPLPLLTLNANGYDIAEYTQISLDSIACDSSASYPNSNIPSISDIPGVDGSYAVCVHLRDNAGNITYGKSANILRDISFPIISNINLANEAADGAVNNNEKNSVLTLINVVASGHSSLFFTLPLDDSANVTCDGTLSYSQTSAPAPSSLSLDGTYAICVKATDAANNAVYGKSPTLTRDTVSPSVSSFIGANGASDGYISLAEASSGSPIVTLSAMGAQVTQYSSIVINTTVCNISVSYPNTNPPAINDLVSDGSYVVCAQLTDAAGNITYTKSSVVVRDVNPPSISTFILANQASDGYINASENASSLAVASMSGSNYDLVSYSAILPDTPAITCDGTQNYLNSVVPSIASATTDGALALCVRLSDVAGNQTFGKTSPLVRDTLSPVFNSLMGANGAADGYISDAEKSSGLVAFTLDANGHTSAGYTEFQPSSVSCNATLTYSLSSIPVISSMSADGNFAVCVVLTDAAGNITFGKSQIISRNVVGPVVTSFAPANEAADGYLKADETSSLLPFASIIANGATIYAFTAILDDSTPVNCDGTQTYGNSAIPSISTIASDGSWALCARVSDASGNIAYAKTGTVLRDTVLPVFSSLLAANEASDGFINDSEKSSGLSLLSLSASGYTTAHYSAPLTSTTTCNGTQTYDNTSIPYVSALPGSDGSYIVCVKLSDTVGNVIYGQSSVVTRDTTAPTIDSFGLVNEAVDGYVSNAEVSSTMPMASLTGSSYTTLSFTNALAIGTNPTCDGSKTFSLPNPPLINTLSSANTYAVCARLIDSAGNIAYGRSPDIIRDNSPPVFTSLARANGASDGFISATEYLSPLPIYTLIASGYAIASYTTPLAGAITCDASKTYGNSAIPAISDIPATDGSYSICVRLTDAAGNTTYGQSASVTRDLTPPSIVSFTAINQASDGFITATDGSSSNNLVLATVTDAVVSAYSNVLSDNPVITCDGSQSYPNAVVPMINQIPAIDDTYVVCGRFADVAGNVVYGKSSTIVRDYTPPVVNAGSDVTKNSVFNTAASVTGAVSYTWTHVGGVGVATIGDATAMNTTVSFSIDGGMTLRLTAVDAAGNSAYDDVFITWDSTPPSFISLNGSSTFSDGYINIGESSSSNAIWAASYGGATSITYTTLLDDTTPVTCNDSQTYSTSVIPTANSVPSDGPWAICIRLADNAGNITYGKSQTIIRDTVVPATPTFNLINAATDGYINTAESTSGLPAYSINPGDYAVAAFTSYYDDTPAVTCSTGDTYGNSSVPAISSMFAISDYFIICVRLTDAAGNIAVYKSQQIFRDPYAPSFSALSPANEASGGYINQTEIGSNLPLYTLSAADYTIAEYSAVVSSTVTCDGSQSYPNASIPLISDLPAIDGFYVVCVKLTDTAGNFSYGKATQVTRDTQAPTVTSFVLSNGASDGYISFSERTSSSALATLVASGASSTTFSAALSDDPAITCDGSKTYSNSFSPSISSISVDGAFALCVLMVDTAGNVSYAKSPQVVRDAVVPTFTSLLAANEAADGYVNGSEYLLVSSLVNLSATNYDSTSYTNVLASTATCDVTQNYLNATAPTISMIPGSDASYAVCVKLTDIAGNITYGKSSTIVRDIIPPTFTSLSLTGAATDGYINDSEKTNASVYLTLSSSGSTAQMYTTPLDDTPSITCDGLQTYGSATIPTPANIPAVDDTYAVCVRLADAAGNFSYGKSSTVIRDTVGPAAVSLSNTPAPFSRDTALNVTVNGADAVMYKSAVLDTYSASCSGASYGSYVSLATPITTVLGVDTEKTLCVLGKDTAGNDQLTVTTYNWRKDTAAPTATTSLTNNTTNTTINLVWNAVTPDYGTYSYLLVRAIGAVSWSPTAGVAYSPGNVAINHDVIYVGSNLMATDTTPAVNAFYEYAVFTMDVAGWYSPGKTVKAVFKPLPTQSGLEGPAFLIHAPENSKIGNSMAISPDGLTLVVGAPGANSLDQSGQNPVGNSGAAYVYTRPNTTSTWTLAQKIAAFGVNSRMTGDRFGESVAISNDTIIVSAPSNSYDDNGANYIVGSGAAYVFDYIGGVVTPLQKISGGGVNSRDCCGYSTFGKGMAIQGNIMVIGNPHAYSDENGANSTQDAGVVFIYTRSGGVWNYQRRIADSAVNGRHVIAYFGYSVTLTPDNILVIGSPSQKWNENGSIVASGAGAAYAYRLDSGNWVFEKKIIPSGTNAWMTGDSFGWWLDMSGDTLVVGSPSHDYRENGTSQSNSGAAFVFVRDAGGNWTQQKQLASFGSGASFDDAFGQRVAIRGDQILVSATNGRYDSSGANMLYEAGSVFSFTRSAGVWSNGQKITASGTNGRKEYDSFGSSLALYDTTFIASSPKADYDATGTSYSVDAGNLFTYEYAASTWGLAQRLDPNEPATRARGDSYYGQSVAVSSDGLSLFVGVPRDRSDMAENPVMTSYYFGAVYYYNRPDTSSPWTKVQKLITTGTNSRTGNEHFGSSVAYDNGTLVVGAISDAFDAAGANGVSSAGAVYVYTYSGGLYQLQQKIIASGTNARMNNDNFGNAVAISGDTLAVGAAGHDYDASGGDLKSSAGAVFVFNRSGGVWTFGDKILASGVNARLSSGNFGVGVDLLGDTLAVAASGDSYNATGTALYGGSGAIYIYRRNAGIWSSTPQKLVDPGRYQYEYYGTSVSLSGSTLAVGASNNSKDDNYAASVTYAGAAFVYVDNAGTYELQKKLIAFGTNSRIYMDGFGGNVKVSGDTLVVTATSQDYDVLGQNFLEGSGAIFTFYRSGTTWYNGRKLTPPSNSMRGAYDYFGSGLAIANEEIFIGAKQQDIDVATGMIPSVDKGAVFFFSP